MRAEIEKRRKMRKGREKSEFVTGFMLGQDVIEVGCGASVVLAEQGDS